MTDKALMLLTRRRIQGWALPAWKNVPVLSEGLFLSTVNRAMVRGSKLSFRPGESAMRTLIKDEVTGELRRPRLLLADDHMIVVEGMTRLLQNDFDILPAVGDGQLLVEAAIRTKPDVIVADISMPILNGI